MNQDSGEGLVRQLTAWGIWLLAVNSMIGAGIFGVPAGAAALTGAWSPVIFIGCALLIAAVMWCFAELASHFRSTGGPILYTRTAFGRFAGFQTGWAFWVARVTAFAANLNLLVASLGFFWPAASGGAVRIALLALIVGLLAWVNVIGVREAMRSIGVLTVLKFLPLVLVVLVGAAHLDATVLPSPAATSVEDLAIGAAALLVIYAFVGWEAAVVPAGETKEPRRAMPRGLFGALAVVTLLYVFVQAVSLAVHPDLAASERALVEVGAILFGPAGALLLTAGIIVSVGGNVAGTMFTAPRLTFALARERTMPAWLGAVHPRHRTPANSVIFLAVVVFALAVFGSFVWLAAMSALVRVLIYMACIASMPALRARFGAGPGAYRVPGGWTVPVAAFLVCGWLLAQVTQSATAATAAMATIGLLLAGSLVYWLVTRRERP